MEIYFSFLAFITEWMDGRTDGRLADWKLLQTVYLIYISLFSISHHGSFFRKKKKKTMQHRSKVGIMLSFHSKSKCTYMKSKKKNCSNCVALRCVHEFPIAAVNANAFWNEKKYVPMHCFALEFRARPIPHITSTWHTYNSICASIFFSYLFPPSRSLFTTYHFDLWMQQQQRQKRQRQR